VGDEKTQVMVVDDDDNIREIIKLYLEKEGYMVCMAENGDAAVHLFKSIPIDIVVLDIMMPEMDGWDTCKEIRKISDVPILMLSAKGESFDRILGLELGADDYLVKPFEPKELLARIKAVLRRYQPQQLKQKRLLTFPNLVIDLEEYVVRLNGETIELAPKEIELLYLLATNVNQVFTREQLIEKVWDYDYLGDSRTIDVHVKRLRSKLEKGEQIWSIKTVWGVGYKFEVKQ